MHFRFTKEVPLISDIFDSLLNCHVMKNWCKRIFIISFTIEEKSTADNEKPTLTYTLIFCEEASSL